MNSLTNDAIIPAQYSADHVPRIRHLGEHQKIAKIAFPIFLAVVCELQQSMNKSFKAFCGEEGWVLPTTMLCSYLALKGIWFLNQQSADRKIPNPSQALKDIPKNWAIGASKIPQALGLSFVIATSVNLIFKVFSVSVEKSIDKGFVASVIKGPFLEELFFRELIQGSMITTMKLINLIGARKRSHLIFTNETIGTSSRIFSAALFGLAHANGSTLSKIQTVQASIIFYYYGSLYEKNGLFASVGLHSTKNFLVFLRQLCS